MRVQIAGAGFSGLTLGYLLSKQGIQVDVLESAPRAGGLLHTERQSAFFAESAANGLLWTENIETMFRDLNISMIHTDTKARRRYIFRNARKRRWPLTVRETFILVRKLAFTWLRQGFKPRSLEAVQAWGERCLGPKATQYLLAPALQGIYAGDISRLSASLIFGKGRVRFKGLVAPENGMSELVEALSQYILNKGGSIQLGATADPKTPGTICAVSAKQFQKVFYPGLDLLSLVKITVRLKAPKNRIGGFGVLFPRGEGVRALGVLSSEDIFGRPMEQDTEAWIYGGALDSNILQLSDEELLEQIRKDRAVLCGEAGEVEQVSISRWQDALPHYTIALEAFLNEFEPRNHRYFTGNYLGQLGLSRIFERNVSIVQEWSRSNV
jgi:oxygen-dependent protoporphyrinogen oxidase